MVSVNQQSKDELRVLHIYKTYYPETQGGLEEVIRQICLNTASSGVHSKVLTLSDQPEKSAIKRTEAAVIQLKRSFEIASCGFSAEAMWKFRSIVEDADILHYHFPWPFADLLHLLLGGKKKTIVTYHSDIVRQRFLSYLYRPLMNQFLSRADSVVCTSPNYFATSSTLIKHEEKVRVIPIGIGDEHLLKDSLRVREAVRSSYGEDFFLFVGVLRYYKGLHILLRALKDAPYKAVIAGAGPIEHLLKDEAKSLNLDNVQFAGYVEDDVKAELFGLCRGVVFPSFLRAEAFGVTLLEGALKGKPLISTEVGSGTSHVNVDGETGFVVAPASPRALRAAMDQLHENKQLAEDMGRRARERYLKHFTGAKMGKRYAKLYLELAESGFAHQKEPAANELKDVL